MSNALLRSMPSAVAALGINAIIAGTVFWNRAPAESAMVLYFFENIVSIALTAARIRILAPAGAHAPTRERGDGSEIRRSRKIGGKRDAPGTILTLRQTGDRDALLTHYLLVSSGFTTVNGVFLAVFIFLILKTTLSSSLIVTSITRIGVFHVFLVVSDLLTVRSLSLEQAESILERSLGRVFLLHIAVLAGVLLAAVVDVWFVVPFIVLKTIVDIVSPISSLMRAERHSETSIR